MKKLLGSFLLAATIMIASLVIASQVLAATIVVNVASDPSVGTANGCSLRQAVLSANRNSTFGNCPAGEAPPAIDEIRFEPALDGTDIVLTLAGAGEDAAETGDLDLTESVNIIGNGDVVPVIKDSDQTTANTLIDGNGLDRAFDIHLGAEVVMEQVAITGGLADFPAGGSGFPGFSTSGGGIRILEFDSSLTLRHVAVFSNRTASGDRSGGVANHAGGGIFVASSLTLENSAVYDNIAQAGGDDVAEGGGVAAASFGSVTISESVIRDNEAAAAVLARGGGIATGTEEQLTIRDSVVSDNIASSEDEALGGGIALLGNDTPGATIERSAIARNEAFARGLELAGGGGIYSAGALTLSNSTVSENRVRLVDDGGGAAGLAIGAGLYVAAGTATLNNSTLTQNSTENFASVATVSGGLQVSDPASPDPTAELIVSNTIVADASGDLDCRGGPIVSAGYNLLGNAGSSQATCAVTPGPDDQIGAPGALIDPLLALPGMGSADDRRIPVGESSFQILNYRPMADSPAIDAGNPNMVAANSPPLCEDVDQRGLLRPADGGAGVGERCDSGAVERNAQALVNVTLAVEDSPDPVEVDQDVTYTAIVSNGGPGDASGLILSGSLPAALSFQSADAGNGSCSESGGSFECALGDLAAGESLELSVVATALAAGPAAVTVTVAVDEPDAMTNDNTLTVTTTVNVASGGSGNGNSSGGGGGGSTGIWMLCALGAGLFRLRRRTREIRFVSEAQEVDRPGFRRRADGTAAILCFKTPG